MPDLIDIAVNKVVSSGTSTAGQASGPTIAAAGAAIAAAGAAMDKLNSLPMDKDPGVIKRQVEAKVQEAKAAAEDLQGKLKEVAIEEGKKKLNSLKILGIPIPPKLPLIDPKILGAVALLKQAKAAIKDRKKKAKKNLDKGRTLYKYDLKSPIKAPSIPSVPKLPTL